MPSQLIRFQIDVDLREAAARVCSDAGFELNDVLRTVVTRIARDKALPPDLGAPPRPAARPGPFQRYDARTWSDVRPPIDSRIAMALLARFIADCSEQLDGLSNAREPDPAVIARLTEERAAARDVRLHLDVTDPDAVARVMAAYGPRVRPGTE